MISVWLYVVSVKCLSENYLSIYQTYSPRIIQTDTHHLTQGSHPSSNSTFHDFFYDFMDLPAFSGP